MLKAWLITLAMLCLLCLLSGLVVRQWPDAYTHVVFCDVGQGDAILIWQGFKQVLVDTGRDEQALECLRTYLPWWDRQLELVVATHADADHIGGFPAIFQVFSTSQLLLTNQVKNSADFRDFKQVVLAQGRKGGQIGLAEAGQQVQLASEVMLTVLWPLSKPENDFFDSLVMTETQLSVFFGQKNGRTRRLECWINHSFITNW